MSKLSDDIRKEIIKEYKEGLIPSKEIALKYKVHPNSISKILTKAGVTLNKAKVITKEQEEKIVEDYSVNLISSEIIASNFDIDGSTVCRILKKNNVIIRPSTENKKKYKENFTFIDVIDSEDKAYWFGMIYSLVDNGKVTLQLDDRNIVSMLSKHIYGFDKIDKEGNFYKLSFTLSKFKKEVKKILDLNKVPKEFTKHFIRGLIENDNEVYIQDSIVYFNILSKLNKFLSTIEASVKIKANNNNGILSFEERESFEFLKYLYNNSNLFIRKDWFEILDKKQGCLYGKRSDFTNYGTYFIPTINNVNLTSVNIKKISDLDKEKIKQPLFDLYRANGFPYTKLSNDDLLKDFSYLQDSNYEDSVDKIMLVSKQAGIQIFKHFSPQFLSVKSGIRPEKLSLKEAFYDDEVLKKTLNTMLDNNDQITGNKIKQRLGDTKIAYKASIFNPLLAKYIYNKYTKENSIIYDYSMGFGQRLLGAMSLKHSVHYIGVDPDKLSYKSNLDIFNFLKTYSTGFNKTVDLNCIGSENFLNEEYIGKVDVAFSSPSYFNLEKYSSDITQAYNGSYIDFIHKYWKSTASNIDKMLSKDGVFILNICDNVGGFNIKNDMCNIIKEFGFELSDTYNMQLTKNLVYTNTSEHKYEPLLVFKRK